MAENTLGLNQVFPIYNADGTSFHDLVLRKSTWDSVVMSLGDKITGDVYYKDNSLIVSMKEYILYKVNPDDENEQPVKYTLVNPPTIVREGIASDNGELKGMTKYSFTFYHPMCQLGNLPFCDVAVSQDELLYLSENKIFSWIGKPADFIAKLNKNLTGTQWKVELSSRFPLDKLTVLSEVKQFDNNTIADALKWGYDTWEVPFIVDTVAYDEEGYLEGKRFKVVYGLPSNEIYEEDGTTPFVFRFGKCVGLKNNSRTPRNNKIVTRVSGYGSEDNIQYGYPQIVWTGSEDDNRLRYPLYDGIVNGQYVKLIKHPFTRTHLMPSIYRETLDKKVNPNNPNYDPDTTLIDYYDAISDSDYSFPNQINPIAPSYESKEFDVKPEFNTGQNNVTISGAVPLNADLTDADSWVDDMDEDGNYSQSYFKLTLPALGFDIYACAAITQEMQINMRSGACIGCTFPVEVDWEAYKRSFYDGDGNFAPSGEQRDLESFPDSTSASISIIVKKENTTFGTVMPNIYQHPSSGDEFVILGIALPASYITSAEERLDTEMKDWMLENNVYYFDYPLKFDEHFLATNTNILAQMKPNVIVRFEFYDETLELFVKQMTIKFGQSALPQYDITLTDNIEVVLNQIGHVADDVEKMGSLISLLRQESGKSVLVELGKKLSRVSPDTAQGLITFLKGLVSKDEIKAEKGLQIGADFIPDITGTGGKIDKDANAELESLKLRRFLEVPELRYNRISIQVGNRWRAPGGGIIESVTRNTDGEGNVLNTGVVKLHLEEGEIGKVAVGDICMGIFHDGMTLSNNDADDFDDSIGNFQFAGFFTTYFKITRVYTQDNPNDTFEYELRPQTNEQRPDYLHPCDMMHFVCYGNFSNPARQESRYSTLTYERYLYGVNNWEFTRNNIGAQYGDLSNLSIFGLNMSGYSAYLNNIYLTGRLEEIQLPDNIVDDLSTYDVDFSDYVDVVTVDDVGNVIGGLYKVEDNVPYDYRIHSAITVRKNNTILTICGANETVGAGKFKIYAEPVRCTCALSNSTIYITSIENIKDGIAGSTDDANFNYNAMRAMTNCYVNLTIDCEGVTSIIKQFPITIKHQSEPFVGADISNEFSSVSWNTRTQTYIGLPITFDFKMWHNNEMLNIESSTNVSLVCATNGITLVNGNAPTPPDGHKIYYSKDIITVNGKKYARIQINALGVDIPSVVDIDVTCTAEYSGVSYERTLRHTINKSTDTNVYQLLTSVAEVSASYNANQVKVLNTNNITCSVRCDSTDDKHYTVALGDYAKHGLFITTIKYTLNGSGQEVAGAEEAYSHVNGVTISTDNVRVQFKLYKLADTTLTPLSSLIAPANVLEVLDLEDVPVVLDGLDGENSIQVVLDNDTDNVTCVEDGSVIAASLSVIHACLMDGEDAIGSSILGSTRSTNKQKYGTISSGELTQGWEIECTDCTAEIANTWTTLDGKPWITINLKTVTEDVASITVKCLYTKHGQTAYYTRLFTVSKLYGIDKHEIILNPNSICYNPNNDTYTPTNFTVYVYKTTQAEDRHLVTTLPLHGTPQHGDYSLQYSLDKGSTWTNITGYSSGAVIRETSDSGSGNKANWDSADSIEIRLRQYFVDNNVGEWILLDQECEDIIGDGQDGKGVEYVFFTQESWIVDTPNGMATPTIRDDSSLVAFQEDEYKPYNSAGTERWTDDPTGVSANVGYKYEFYAQRKKVNGVWQAFGTVHLWNKYVQSGTSPYVLDLSNDNSFINCDDNGTVLGTYETTDIMIFEGGRDVFDDFNYTVTGHNITATRSGRTITPSNIQAISAEIVVEATLKTNSSIKLTAVYSINKMFPGDSTVIYSLQPSLNVFHKAGDNGSFTDNTFSVQVKKSVGNDFSLLTTAQELSTEGLKVIYTKDGGSTVSNLSGSITGIPVTQLLSGVTQYITLYLQEASAPSGQQPKTFDRERLCIVKDGDQGDAFEYEDFTEEQLEALRGPRGLTGCHERVFEIYTQGMTYRNDENDDTITGVRYVDFIAEVDNTLASGYRVWMCKETHEALSATFADDREANPTKWEPVSENAASAFFTYLIAKNAHFKFGSGNQFVIQDSNGNTVAGLTGAIPDANREDESVRIWAGGSYPYLAPFRVLQDGQMFADKAHIKGLVEIKNANEGVMVYDSNDNLRVQIVAGEVAEPVNESITVSGAKTSNYSLVNGNFSLTPTPISMSLGTLKAGAMAYPSVGFNVTTNGGNQVMKITNNNGIEERFVVTVSLVTSNGVVVGSTSSTFTSSSSSGTDIEDFGVGLRGLLVPTTAPYYLYVSASIENVNTGNTGAGTFGSLSTNASVTTNINGGCLHKTPVGTRIGTNGMFVNLGNNKAFNITADKTEIRYSNYRLRIDSQGLYASSDGINYYPFVKRTKILNDSDFTNNTYEVKPDDGVLFLNNSNAVTLTLTSNSSDEVKIVSKTGTTYALGGSPVYRCNGDATQTFGVNDKKARMFVKDTLGNYFEFYCCN